MSEETKELTIYYDGACPLCSAEIRHYEKRPGAENLCFVNLADPATDTGGDLPMEAALARFHVRRADGRLLSGARAFTAIWAVLPGWRWAARLARIPGVLPLLETGYRLFLPLRPALSRLAARVGALPRTPS